MTRTLLWMPVALVTFLIGIAALLFSSSANSGLSNCTVKVRPSFVAEYPDCVAIKSFPGRSVSIANLPKNRNHFPSGIETRGEGLITMNEWYGKHLRAMSEPALWKESKSGAESYRFLWLRTFDHPIAVRVEQTGSTATLFLKELNGAGGYDPGQLIATKSVVINPEEWCAFIKKLERANYWNSPLHQDGDGLDGAQWIVEGVREGRYHVVDRWSPESGAFREACTYLLELAGVETGKLGDELY